MLELRNANSYPRYKLVLVSVSLECYEQDCGSNVLLAQAIPFRTRARRPRARTSNLTVN